MTVKVWDASTGQEILTLSGHTDVVTSVAFSPDGQRIVSGSRDRTVKVWDVSTGQEALTLRGHRADVNSVAISPDGRRIVSGSGMPLMKPGEVKVWDASTGQEVLTLKGHSEAVVSVVFSRDGRRIASAGRDAKVNVWDARDMTSDSRIEREAVGFLDFLFHHRMSKADVIDRLKSDATVSDKVRLAAQRLLKQWNEAGRESAPFRLHRFPKGSGADRRFRRPAEPDDHLP